MALKENIVVLFANPYSVDDDKRKGEKVEGVSVSYLYGESMEPMLHPNGALGQRPAKCSLPVSSWDKFSSAPALYEGSFEMSIGSDGKPMLRLVDVDFLSFLTLDRKHAGEKKGAKNPAMSEAVLGV